MSSLLNVRAAYLVALEAALAPAKVYVHGGAFDAKQLATYGRQAPAVVLTLLRFDAVRQGGYPVAIAHWGLVAFTKNEPSHLVAGARFAPQQKDESCVALMEQAVGALLPLFGGSTSTQPVSSALKQIHCRNMFGTGADAEGIAMWGAEFAQQLDLVQTDTSVDLKRFHIDYDLAATADLETDAEDLLEDLDTTPVP